VTAMYIISVVDDSVWLRCLDSCCEGVTGWRCLRIMLRRIQVFGPKKEVTDDENDVMRSFLICTLRLTSVLLGWLRQRGSDEQDI